MIQELNDQLGRSRTKFGIAVTGAAMTGATEFFRGTGASAFIEAIEIPYGNHAWERLCGRDVVEAIDPKVSMAGANALATAMARKYDIDIGIGVSGKLCVPNEREGRLNVVYYAAYYNDELMDGLRDHLELILDHGTREEQEALASRTLHEFMLRNLT
jgi:nicotinamide mononucleotide (NMN) deamidase PncC